MKHDDAWQWLIREADEPELRIVAAAAFNEPRLRALFPFASVGRLRFSRDSSFPYDLDLPFVVSNDDGSYEARGREGSLGRGSAHTVARLVADAIGGM
jgi:hypothetical protein